MSRIFTRKQFSNYLGENRAINDIITKWTYVCPSEIVIGGSAPISGINGTYERLLDFDGYVIEPSGSNNPTFYSGEYPGTYPAGNRTYAVYGRQDGTYYYTLVWTLMFGNTAFYRVYKTTNDYVVSPSRIPNTSVGSPLGVYTENVAWTEPRNNIWYPLQGDYLNYSMNLTYPSPCSSLPEPTYWVVNVLDCDCNEQLASQILKDTTGNVSSLSLNDSFSNEFNPNVIFYLVSSSPETTPDYTINRGLFSSDPDCSLVTCFPPVCLTHYIINDSASTTLTYEYIPCGDCGATPSTATLSPTSVISRCCCEGSVSIISGTGRIETTNGCS